MADEKIIRKRMLQVSNISRRNLIFCELNFIRFPKNFIFRTFYFSKLGVIRIPKAFKEMDDVQYKYKPFNIEHSSNGQTRLKRSDNSTYPIKNELWLENANDDVNRTAAERQAFITKQKDEDYAAKKV